MDDERDKEMESQIWGTWEDLLLVYSVRRHRLGGDFLDWDSVSVDVSNRTNRCKTILITSQICQQRYHHLERRFQDTTVDRDIPWEDELRKTRVAELRRDVKKYDVSILLLQSKLKRLTEKVGRNVTLHDENTVGDQKQDLGNIVNEESDQDRKVSSPALIKSEEYPAVGSCDDTNSHEPKHLSSEFVEKSVVVANVKKKIPEGNRSCNGNTKEEVQTKKIEFSRSSESGGSTKDSEDGEKKVSVRLSESGGSTKDVEDSENGKKKVSVQLSESGRSSKELENNKDGEKKVSVRPQESGDSISMSKEGIDVKNDTKLTAKHLKIGDLKKESKGDDEKTKETKVPTRLSESGDLMSKSKEDVEMDHNDNTFVSVRSKQSGDSTSNLKEGEEVEKETIVSGDALSKSKEDVEMMEKELAVPSPPLFSDNSTVKETKVSIRYSESGESMVGSKNGVDMEKEKTNSLRLPASGESLADTMVGDDSMKDNSDVQSCSKRKFSDREKGAVSVASSGNSKPCDVDDASISLISDEKSQPLIDFLDFIRSHKDYYIFERAIKIQDSARYRNMIRQHIDMVTIRTKLEVGGSSYTSTELFRDLLLLCNNAIVFFPKNSNKFTAATRLRQLVNKEIAKIFMSASDGGVRKLALSSPSEPSSIAPSPLTLTNSKVRKTEPESNTKTLPLSGSFQTFGKRSSISTTKAATTVTKEEKVEEDYESELKLVDKQKRSRPRTTKGRRAIAVKKKNDEVEISSSNAKKPNTAVVDGFVQESFKNTKKNTGGCRSNTASAEVAISGVKMKGIAAAEVAISSGVKRKGVAGFLDRMKSSPSKSGSVAPKLKNTGNSSGGRVYQNNRGKESGKKEHRTYRQRRRESSSSSSSSSSSNASTKQTSRKPSTLKKRNVGRPPKKPVPTPSSQPPSKRSRVDREISPLPPPIRNSRKRRKM